MAGINEINSLNNFELSSFLANKYIHITENLDAYRFTVQKNENNSFSFFRKNQSQELNEIDRLLSDIHEKPISHIKEVTKDILKNIPTNLRFGFSYFPANKPLRLFYNKIPKNNLILTDVSERKDGKIINTFEDRLYLNRWSELFKVDSPPIIFSGTLNEKQQKAIIELISNLNETESSINFEKTIIDIFGNTYSKNHTIKGLIFKTDEELYKLNNPVYELFEYSTRTEESRDMYDLIVSSIENHLKNSHIHESVLEEKPSLKYIEIINKLFNDYVTENHKNIDLKSIDPNFLKPPIIGHTGDLNIDLIKNKKTISLINEHQTYKELYKVFISLFRRKRKPYGLLTENKIESLNSYIEKIHIKSNLIFEEVIPQKIEKNTNKSLSNLHLISSLQKTFKHKFNENEIETQNKNKIDVILGNFNPFNNSHQKLINTIVKDNKKCVLVNVSDEHLYKSNEKFHISKDIKDKILKSILNENKESIEGLIIINYESFKEILIGVRQLGFEPDVIYTELGHGANLNSQLNLYKNDLGNRLNIGLIDIKEYENKNHYYILRNIESNKFTDFKELVPGVVSGFWNLLISEFNKWKIED